MRALLQRVSQASVVVNEQTVGQIDKGLLIFLGVSHSDSELQVKALVDKIVYMRIFEDEQSKMNLSILDIGGQVLVVSQFTLYADIRKGRRPSFNSAAPPTLAEPLVECFKKNVAAYDLTVSSGIFGAHMNITLTNDGPVTIWLDSEQLTRNS